jgi:type VI secretion system protein ImpA
MDRIQYDINDLIKEIQGSENGIGKYLIFDQVYDEIKRARLEDDVRLPVGVWQTEPKKADWLLVEQITIDALINKSKDLQVVGWLIEATIHIEEFKGMSKAFNILITFVESFWYTAFPLNDGGESDTDQKIKLLIWILDTINKLIINTPFLKNEDTSLTLYEYDYAMNIKSIMTRSPEATDDIMRSVKKDKRMTVEDIQSFVKTIPQEFYKTIDKYIFDIKKWISTFITTVKKILNEEKSVSLVAIIENLDKIQRIIAQYVITTPPQVAEQQVKIEPKGGKSVHWKEITDRDQLYDIIGQLSTALQKIDRHSPSYSVLGLVFSWKEKSLLEIINDLKTGESEAHKLLRILLSA